MILLPLLNQEHARLSLDLTNHGVAVSPLLYAQMTEEINYSFDGGLYGALVRNRGFLDDPEQPTYWTPVGMGSSPNMRRMIADAAFMTGLERNPDIVAMACYAPLLVNVNDGGRQRSNLCASFRQVLPPDSVTVLKLRVAE